MVSFKGKEAKGGGGIRILEDPRPSKTLRDFKGRNKPGGADSSVCTSRVDVKEMPRVALRQNKSVTVNPAPPMIATENGLDSIKGSCQNAKQKTGKCNKPAKVAGRKPLVDLSNANPNRRNQLVKRLSNGCKPMKDITERSNTSQDKTSHRKDSYGLRVSLTKNVLTANASSRKFNLENGRHPEATAVKTIVYCNIGTRRKTISEATNCQNPQGNHLSDASRPVKNQGLKLLRPRLSLATQKVADRNTSSRKPFKTITKSMQTTSKPKKNTVMKQKIVVETSTSSNQSMNEKIEVQKKTECDHSASVSSPEGVPSDAQLDSSQIANDSVTASISRPKCKRRKSYTLSLMARSEVFGECPDFLKKDELPNIDDRSNPLEVVEYVDDIYQYYWMMEVQNSLRASYMTIQSEITPRMRGILINWLIEVHFKFELMQETLFLMVELLDRLLSLVTIKKNELQMVGLASLLLASKYEDFWHPKIDDLISISANLYSRDQMLAMEKFILKKLKFRLNMPTPYLFMLRFLKAAQAEKKLEHLAFYLIELCLVESEALKFKPSLLCASAIYIARCTLNRTPAWTGLLEKHAHYKEPELRDCAHMILRFQRAASQKPIGFTYEKFQSPNRSCVAELKALDELPL